MSHNAFEEGLGYEGKVTLTLKSNNRILKSQTYKNNGTANLFKFLGYCLIGHFSDVEELLPTQIALLWNDNSLDDAIFDTNVEARSALISLAQTPSIISTANPAEVRVTYSFEVPKYRIIKEFNQVALYGKGCSDAESDIGNCSAYYYLANNERNEFEPIDPSQWSDTTVLLIDWELRLSNAEVENN